MSDVTFWRQVLKDSSHPLYKAAWVLFSPKTTGKSAAKTLADQKEQIMPYIMQILATDELFEAGSLGDGFAPINCVDLLAEWQVLEAVPNLLKILDKGEWDSVVYDRTIKALDKMGSSIVDEVMRFGDRYRQDDILNRWIAAVSILSEVGKGNEAVFEWMGTLFEETRDEEDAIFVAEQLLHLDQDKAIPFLEQRLGKKHKIARQTIRDQIQRAKLK